MGQKQQVTGESYQPSAISSQLSHERCEHSFHLYGLPRKALVIRRLQQLEIFGEEQMILQLAGRTRSHLEKPRKVYVSPLRQDPSAMLAPMDADALRIWLVSPYISSLGNDLIDWYTSSVKT
jgi:hypothetical protein